MRFLMRRICSVVKPLYVRPNVSRNFSKDAEKKKDEPQQNIDLGKTIVVEKYESLVTLNIDRQDVRNSLDVPTLLDLAAALDAFEKDDTAKVLVINGEGGNFCAGFDVDEIISQGYYTVKDASNIPWIHCAGAGFIALHGEETETVPGTCDPAVEAIFTYVSNGLSHTAFADVRLLKRPLCDKPTIAAISGYAVAEGFELALACDLRVVEDTAVLGFLGRRFGIPQGIYGGRRLTSMIGLSRALDLLMTGRLISGTEAHQMGLVCKLTATGTALGEAVKLAKSLVKFPQNALIMDKLAAVNSQLNPNSEESMRDEAVMTSLLGNAQEDIKEGVKKFQGGIGKHGKFYKLSEVPLKDWELEESHEETTVKLEPKKPQDKTEEKKEKP